MAFSTAARVATNQTGTLDHVLPPMGGGEEEEKKKLTLTLGGVIGAGYAVLW